MAANPVFAVTPRLASVSVATADSSYTAPTNVGTLITGAATGTRISEIVIKGAGATSAAVVRIFLYDGSTYYLFDEVLITAISASSTLRAFGTNVFYTNLVLPSTSWSIRVTTSVSQATHVTAMGADL